jgi:hypothetical protein
MLLFNDADRVMIDINPGAGAGAVTNRWRTATAAPLSGGGVDVSVGKAFIRPV